MSSRLKPTLTEGGAALSQFVRTVMGNSAVSPKLVQVITPASDKLSQVVGLRSL